MDFISKRAIEINALALDGLSQRHKVLSSNIANAETPGFKRSDVQFEDQLRNIMQNDDSSMPSMQNNSQGMTLSLNSLDGFNNSANGNIKQFNQGYDSFKPQTVEDDQPAISENGNNVNIESEMTELAKNGMKYNVITDLEGKMFRGISDVIRGVN